MGNNEVGSAFSSRELCGLNPQFGECGICLVALAVLDSDFLGGECFELAQPVGQQ